MKKIYRAKRRIKKTKKYNINYQISAPQVRLVDDSGEMLGIVPTKQAIQMAKEKEADLVEISPKANPPVAKILDYGKFQYQQEKIMRKQKSMQKKADIKGIRLSARISEHDMQVRIDQAKKFIDKRQKVKIEVVLRGREQQFANRAKDLIKEFLDKLETDVTIEQPLQKQGNRFSIQIAPKN